MRMRVAGVTLAAAVVMLVCSGAMAAGGMKYGGKFALNFSSARGDDAEALGMNKPLLGVGVGGTVDISLGGGLTLETGLAYVQKGGQGTADAGGGMIADTTFTAEYLEVPVMVKYELSGGAAYVSGGLTLDFLSTAEMKAELMGVTMTVDMKDDTTALDLCLALGGGASFIAGPGTLNVGVQYSTGLATVDDAGVLEMLTQSVSVMVTYTF